MKIIAFATLKGGAGKTANAFNIAGILAEDHQILLIDMDPQCNLSINCGIDVTNRNTFSIKDVFDNKPKDQPAAEKIIIKSPIVELPGIDIIPSSILLFQSELKIANSGNREHILENFLAKNKKTMSQYEYIIIDTNPSMSLVNINGFYVADEIIINSDVSANSINGAELFCALWDEKREELFCDDNISSLLICNFSKRTNMGRDLLKYAKNAVFSRDLILDTVIPATVKIKESEAQHKPVNLIYPGDEVCIAFRNVVKELKEREVL